MEISKGRSTPDVNALGARHIKGAFFFSRRLFEWDVHSINFEICSVIFSKVNIFSNEINKKYIVFVLYKFYLKAEYGLYHCLKKTRSLLKFNLNTY